MMNKAKKHHSVVTMVSMFLVLLVVLFIASTAFSYSRLVEFQTILSRFSSVSFPEVVRSEKIFHLVSELTFSAEGLTHASSNASRRIAFNSIRKKIKGIESVFSIDDKAQQFDQQLNAITTEFISLNDLIKLKFTIQQQVEVHENALYQSHEKLLAFSNTKFHNNNIDHLENDWVSKYSELIVLSGKALTNYRLQRVRQIAKEITNELAQLKLSTANISVDYQNEAARLISELEAILLHEHGLFSLKIKQLRIVGRAIGRGNFVKNMSEDFSRKVEARSYQINASLIEKTQATAQQVANQAKIMAMLALFVLFILFSVIYIIKTRLVERLVKLNHKVQARLTGKKIPLFISGNDEISDIANSMNYFAEKIEEQKRILHNLSQTDGLTGIANRRALDERMLTEMRSAKRNKQPLAVLMTDIDDFKAFNDNHGHLSGDECLKVVSKILSNCKQRTTDFVARYGGEEFVFILPNTDAEGATKFAQVVLKAINESRIEHGYSNVREHITISAGVAVYRQYDDCSAEVLLDKADKALYMAKKAGKNRAYFGTE